MARIEIKDITKCYGETKVLSGINMTVEDGQMFFLLGASGCGKSTLLRIIAGLLDPTSGTILADNQNLLAMPPEKRGTPMVFQNYALWPHMDVFENVAFSLKSQKMPSNKIKDKVHELLALVRLENLAHRKIPALSGGQQQRVALARAMAATPKVLLLDEPLSNLDAKLRDSMRLELKRICREQKMTAIYVTHDRREALSMADQVAVMNNGLLLEHNTPRKIYLEPQNRFTASFLGDANILEVNEVKASQVVTPAGTFTLSAPPPPNVKHVMFRPESVIIDSGTCNTLNAEIKDTAYLGESSFLTLKTNGVEIYANEFSPLERITGTKITISIPPEKIVALKD